MSDLVIEQITLEKANLIIKSAIDKAREIKIKIMTEKQWYELLNR